jgi:hypothetical protein
VRREKGAPDRSPRFIFAVLVELDPCDSVGEFLRIGHRLALGSCNGDVTTATALALGELMNGR